MFKHYSKLIFRCFFIISIFGIIPATGQIKKSESNKYEKQIAQIVESYDQAELSNIYSQLSSKALLNRAEAKSYAILHNIPLRYENAEGVLFELQFIADDGSPIYFQTFNANAAISARANYLNTGGGLGLNLNGDDLTAHVWDGGLARSTHQEYDGTGGNNRFSIGDGTAVLNFHAAHVTGTIMASGVDSAAKGMAWQANAVGYDWNNDTSEATTAASNGMLVSNHSYGYGASGIPDAWFGQYGADARDWDAIMRNAPYYLMVVAAGNDGNDNVSNGVPLDGQAAYDKLSGHATSKNNLVVANGQDATINPDGSLNSVVRNSGSSEGPTDDYRIKPDIMGNGTSLYSTREASNSDYGNLTGTSMASPNVAGTLLLLQEHYVNLHASFMRAATLKGLALHTADDVAPTGPDAQTGWGLMNAKKAAETLTTAAASSGSAIVEELTLVQGQTYQITVQANGVDPLMASISWTDLAGTINNGTNSNTPALVNDLDIRLSNGTTYTPWRLTAVNSNTKGDNTVDPYERVDINGASGTYTLTVTHKGTLSGGSQNFSLIVSGAVVASSPLIGFAVPTGAEIENTDCSYTDVNVIMNIAQAPSQNADVTFTIGGGSTATSGLDFDLMTPTVTFPSGSTGSQNMVLRVYHDGFVEGEEIVLVSFTVNPNGGDAGADTNADTFTFTINDDDVAPLANQNLNLLFEDFEDSAGWVIIDGDGDGNNWSILADQGWTSHQYSGNFAVSYSWYNVPLTPDNYLISPAVTIPLDVTAASVSYIIGSANDPVFYKEHYSVYFTTNITSTATIQAGTILENDREIPANGTENRSHNLLSLAGQTGYFVVRHHNVTDEFILGLDTVSIDATIETPVQTAVNTGTTNDLIDLAGAGTIYTSDSVTGNVMLDITNNNSFDYGCTDTSVSRAGTGAQQYNGSTFPNLVMDKNFRIGVGNSTSSGNTSVKFYFTPSEITGWEAATGLSRTQLVAYRTDGDETSPLTIGAFGTNIILTGNFTGLSGDYLFGPAAAFVDCPGSTTYTSSGWSNGVPTANLMVIIDENYSTSTANLDACTLVVNAGKTLTVPAGTYVKSEGNITVNGTLFVDHEGSLVQVDDAATVTNNGNITVRKITPFLAPRDFMVLGSPMTAETRSGVYGSSVIVRNHITSNFVPHPDVETQDPLAENFADDNGNDWQNYTGTINAGEGYLVLPQPDLASSGSYTLDYTQGTLNNGQVNYNVTYNGSQNSSPNIVGNPYASAIDANLFLDDLDNTMIDAVYFWEHLTSANPSYPGYKVNNYDMGDISMYNSSGGVPAANDPGNSTQPNGYISSGQGFGFKATAAGTATFKNYMRVTDNNNTYRRPIAAKDRIWLQVSNETYGLNSTVLISFSEESIDGYDARFDAKRLATPVSLYSLLDTGEELAIQGRNAFNENQEIPLGFVSQIEENQEFTIAISNQDGTVWPDVQVYLVDRAKNIVHNLSNSHYIFKSKQGVHNDRFEILFKSTVLDTPTNQLQNISIVPNPTTGYITIVSPQTAVSSAEVFDIRGRKLMTVDYNNAQYSLDLSSLQSATYFVKINTQEGSLVKRVVKN
ncbi:MAG: S8 family serine peptidase [Aequorivita sp.]|nr:S8 family serine peptidase [Aequorivita sp.]